MTTDDLKKDLESLVAQANQINGAIQYIRQKIAAEEKAAKNGKAPEAVEAPVSTEA